MSAITPFFQMIGFVSFDIEKMSTKESRYLVRSTEKPRWFEQTEKLGRGRPDLQL